MKPRAPSVRSPNCPSFVSARTNHSPDPDNRHHTRLGSARLTCFRGHRDVFFLDLGDNRTFHLTITEPWKSSDPVPEH